VLTISYRKDTSEDRVSWGAGRGGRREREKLTPGTSDTFPKRPKCYLELPAHPPFLWQAATEEKKKKEVMIHNLQLLEFLN
jgi:hypothetical protein